MSTIDVFYQGEGFREIEFLAVEPTATFGAVKALIVEKHGLDESVLIFLEDEDEPVAELVIIGDIVDTFGIKAHLHKCRHIAVTVTFNGETVSHSFSPSKTIAAIKTWAAETKFGMTKEEASEHVLQIAGSHDRPTAGTHIGQLAKCPSCHLALDLVPDQRVNGAPSGGN